MVLAPTEDVLEVLGERLAHGLIGRAGDRLEAAVVAVERPEVARRHELVCAGHEQAVGARDHLREAAEGRAREGREVACVCGERTFGERTLQ